MAGFLTLWPVSIKVYSSDKTAFHIHNHPQQEE